MRQGGTVGASSGPVSASVLRRLTLAMLGAVLLMGATLAGTWWMARQQDAGAQSASRRMVSGGLDAFVDRSKAMLLDYAIWTDAYDRIVAGDVDWMSSNIGASAAIGTFDAVVVLRPEGEPLGWGAGGGPLAELPLDRAAIATATRQLGTLAIDGGTAESAYVRSGGELWFLAIGRVLPQEGVPAGAGDADLPRMVIGFRVDAELLSGIGRRFVIEDLAVGPTPVQGRDSLALEGTDGQPLAYVTWTPPMPGRAVLRVALWPLVGLMIAVAAIVLVASRELVRSARELEAALAQARTADRTKTEFLSNVSHELRTPLNGIIGVAQLLQLRQQDAEARHMLGILMASAQSQLHLVNGLLDIARIESGTMTLEREPFDPAAVLEDTVRLMAPEIEAKRLACAVSVAPEARRPVLGDALAFRQIATNLIGNALKFTDRGRIAIDLGTDGTGRLLLVVADTGVGIDPAQHARIFERFVQVDGASARRAGGTGLGLAITSALVELKQGSIRVASALGEGATFTVALPLPPATAIATAA